MLPGLLTRRVINSIFHSHLPHPSHMQVHRLFSPYPTLHRQHSDIIPFLTERASSISGFLHLAFLFAVHSFPCSTTYFYIFVQLFYIPFFSQGLFAIVAISIVCNLKPLFPVLFREICPAIFRYFWVGGFAIASILHKLSTCAAIPTVPSRLPVDHQMWFNTA